VQVVLDTNIWVSGFDPEDPFHAECFPLMQKIFDGQIEVACPTLVLVETACTLFRRTRNSLLVKQIQQELVRKPSITWHEVSLAVARRACQLGMETGLKGGDAIILLAAKDLGLPLLTKDKEIQAKAPATIQILEPGDLSS
jgi:predicted nucleic acid-binding protein